MAHQSAVDIIGELQAELAEARKKPEPTEFTKKGRAFISQVLNNWGLISVRTWVIEACDEIDRQAAELKAKDKRIAELEQGNLSLACENLRLHEKP